jgi:hypothetical protein
VVFQVVTPCSLYVDNISEEHAASVFRAKARTERTQFKYIDKFQGRWSLRSILGGDEIETVNNKSEK